MCRRSGPIIRPWCRISRTARCARWSPPRRSGSPVARRADPDETGITKYEAEIFYGVVAPTKTPPRRCKNISTMLTNAMNTPEMKAKFVKQGLFPDGGCGEKFGEFLRNLTADYEATTAAGIKPN